MAILKIERIGGFAGFGGINSRLQSIGEVNTSDLSLNDKRAIEDLFAFSNTSNGSLSPDTFRYKISRTTSKGTESIEASEDMVPNLIKQSVKDQII
ncbi:hypothetical protein IM793_24245 [Pedobacter sp. MR2016-19]|uniref:protealysin inhibitor emfourin n=1 Tax=Pedobacter sp. MR2016-19 TaxID=2780089 RepID=UPI001873807A|nr:protealysin inhibitor emfourin [Pedobacter sp. MR2016-19]MBE5322282.1 hypothetical protein [Pedobacter sp. MR2016-19]